MKASEALDKFSVAGAPCGCKGALGQPSTEDASGIIHSSAGSSATGSSAAGSSAAGSSAAGSSAAGSSAAHLPLAHNAFQSSLINIL